MSIICKTCGVRKRNHSKSLWEAHKLMHEAYKKQIRETNKLRKKPIRN